MTAGIPSVRRRSSTGRDGRGYHPCGGTSDLPDPFAVNPIRRSFALVAFCTVVVGGPLLIGGAVATSVMLTIGWLAVTGIVLGTPIFLWSVAEAVCRLVRRRLQPSVEELDLSPRVRHVLRRHGYDAIARVDRSPDAALLILSNMDARGLREVRRAINLWKYRRWQERGFPAGGYE